MHLFLMVLRKDINNINTEIVIYWTYKWKVWKKEILKIQHITFLMTWLLSKILIQLSKNRQKFAHKIDIYYIGYITTQNIGDYDSIRCLNALYLIIGEVDVYSEEKDGNKYVIFNSTYKSKEMLTKYAEPWDGTKNQIEKMNDKEGDYGNDFMEMKFNSDDTLPLNKILKLHNLTIVVRCVFQEDNKYYPLFF